MPLTVEQIVEETRKLPRPQVAELLERLAIELGEGVDPVVEEEWLQVARQRLDEIESGQVKPVPGEEVMARARKLIGR